MAIDLRDRARLDEELSGLDSLELAIPPRPSRLARVWSALWPKLAAVGIALCAWQLIVWSGWKPEFVLPGPRAVFGRLWEKLADGSLPEAIGTTMWRAAQGFGLAIVIGTAIGIAVSQSRILRAAFGSLITGLMTMPSIAWFPLAIILFKLTNEAILFVVVLGAAPSIANGLIHGIDHIPPTLLRVGRVLGARGFNRFWHVVLPAALPNFVSGLKQGWAFAWRSLMAGELLVIIANQTSLGQQLGFARQFNDSESLIAVMIVILVIGIVIDALFFATVEKAIRRRYGLIDEATE
ncbi:MAG: ABC transporter permease [Acidimicrobiia bacterium]